MENIQVYKGVNPNVDPSAFIADNAKIIGDVKIGKNSSVWFQAVVRGDEGGILIGDESNIQDLCVLHTTQGIATCVIGNRVTVGHRAILHSCTVEDDCLIGMGACVMDKAVIGRGSIVGAGALVTEGTIVPPKTLVVGIPAKPRRDLTDDDVQWIRAKAAHYVQLSEGYKKG